MASPARGSSQTVDLNRILFGLAAGLAGTAAMSVSQRIEIALTGREPSTSPAEAMCNLLGFETRTTPEERRLAEEAHWAYGTAWGLGHPVMQAIPEPGRSLAYLATVWSAGAMLMSATRVAPPPTQWKPRSLASDLLHHAVYTAAGALTFAVLIRAEEAFRRH